MTPGPIVSVVLLSDGDPRYEREFAESWVRQTCPADLYEIVVVGHADDSGLNDRFQGILRPQDRVVGVPRGGLELLHAGAVAARADWVFTTEDHCRGEPDCLARVVEFVPTATSVGAFMEYGHINKTWVGRLETASYERWFPIWTSSGWNNVRLRGMVLERNTFIEMAEQCRGYGPFFELAVAMRYHQRGHRMAAIPHLGLLHSNCHTLGELTGHTTEYIFGECRYRDDHHATEWEPYIDLPDEWIERGNFEPGASRPTGAAVAHTLWRAVRSFPGKTRIPEIGALGFEFASRLPHAIFGPKLRVAMARAGRTRASIRARLRLGSVRSRAVSWMDAATRCARIEYAATQTGERALKPSSLATITLADMDDGHRAGFYLPEMFEDRAFRWSRSVASIKLDIPATDYRAEIRTVGVRKLDRLPLGIFFNGHRAKDAEVVADGETICFTVQAEWFVEGMPQTLMIVCPSTRSRRRSGETRRLGLPVHSIGFERREM